jgi:hypothetical protein
MPAPLWGFPPAYIEANGVTAIPSGDWVHLTSVLAGNEAEIQVEVLELPASDAVQEIALWLNTQGADGTHDGAMALWSFLDDSSFIEVQRPNNQNSVVIQRTGPVGVGLHMLRVVVDAGGEFQVWLDGELIGSPPVGSMPPGYAAIGSWGRGNPVARITSFSTGGVAPPLTCTPSPVERGQEMKCTVNVPDAWRVTRWEFRADDEQPPLAARAEGGMALRSVEASSAPTVSFDSDTTEWVGPVAVGGAVTVYVSDPDGASHTFDTTFAVTEQAPSPWQSTWKYRRGTTPPLKLTVPDHEPFLGIDTYGQNCPEQSCLLTRRLQPDPVDSTDRAVTPFHIKVGPNQGIWIVGAAHFNMERVANVNPGILPTATRTHSVPLKQANSVCIQGLGASSKAKTANANWWQFNNYCGGDPAIQTGRNMTDFVDGVWAHEEFGRNGGTGHESLSRAEAAKPVNDPYVAMKGIYALDSLTLMGLVSTKALAISNRINLASADNSPNRPAGNVPPGGYLWFWGPGSKGQLVWGAGIMHNGL